MYSYYIRCDTKIKETKIQ